MWKTVKLGDVCTIKTGKKDVNEGNPTGEYPFFTCAKEHTFSDVYSFDCEAILIAGNGAVGQTTYYEGKFEAYQRTYVLTDFYSVHPKLLLFILQGRLMQHLSSIVLGNTIPYIKKGMLQNFEFPLPPLAQQQRIVAKLDAAFAEIDRAIELAESKHTEVEKLKAALLSSMLRGEDWETVKLSEIAMWARGLTYSKKDEVDADGIAVLRATNIDLATHKIVLDEIRYISKTVKVKDDKYAQLGDLLVCTASGSKSHVGKVAIVEEDLGMAFGGFMAAIRCNEHCLPRFLYHVLTSQNFKWHLRSLGDGANINNLKFSQIEEYGIPLPPLAEQHCIVAKLDAAFAELDRAKASVLETKAHYQALKSAILAQELTPPQSEAA